MDNTRNMKKLEKRYADLKKQFEQMVESNTKLVDDTRMYKNDIKNLIRFILHPEYVDKDAIDNIIEYYNKTLKINTVNEEEVSE